MITLDSLQSDLHSVEIKSAAGNALAIDSSGYLTLANTSFAVTATALDIRALLSSTDSVEIKTAAGVALAIDASGYITIANSSFAVTATDLDIRDLTHVSDSVKVGDGTDFLAINSDGSVNVVSSPDSFDTWKTTAQSITSTVSQIAATALAGRDGVEIQNLGSHDIYIGTSNAVTTSTGIKIAKGSSYEKDLSATATIWAITASGSSDVRIAEYAY